MNYVAAIVAGLLLAASDHPLHWWPLQFVAFVPFWWGLWRQRGAGRRVWTFGLGFAGTYTLGIVLAAGPAPPVLVAALASLAQWALAALLAARHIGRGAVRGPLAAAAMVTLVELVTWHLVPVFGTAQAFVRPLSAAPALVAFAAFTGVGGVVFVVTALQALLVSALRGPRRWQPLLAFAAIVAVVASLDAARWQRALGPTQRVAAFGWGTDSPQSPDGSSFVQIAAMMAAGSHATLLVTPEVGLPILDREKTLQFFGDLAARHAIAMAVGIWHDPTKDNRIWFFDVQGKLVAEYRKTHLVPFFEHYATGDGRLAVVPLADTQLGGMICQDDNFTDLARGYGRLGVPLVAVPTNDWPAIREFHLENAVFRSIENGYAVVRAASNGISALVSPRGEVVLRCDHVSGEAAIGAWAEGIGEATSQRVPGAKLLYADLPLGDGVPTVYARYGDTPMLLLCATLVLFSLRRRRPPA